MKLGIKWFKKNVWKPSHIEITLSVNGWMKSGSKKKRLLSVKFSEIWEMVFVWKKSVFLFTRKTKLVLDLPLCLWKCVFAGFLGAH